MVNALVKANLSCGPNHDHRHRLEPEYLKGPGYFLGLHCPAIVVTALALCYRHESTQR